MISVSNKFSDFRAACGDPRDRDLYTPGGALSAARFEIGGGSSSSTRQTATNQQVAVSGSGTAIGARTNSVGNVSGRGAAVVSGSPGAIALTFGDKNTGAVAINSPTTTNNTNTNSGNRITQNNSNNTTTTTTINNSGTSDYTTNQTYDYTDPQAEAAIAALSDTVTHLSANAGQSPIINVSAPAPVVYVSTPAGANPTVTPDNSTPGAPGPGNGITGGEIAAIIGALVLLGGIVYLTRH